MKLRFLTIIALACLWAACGEKTDTNNTGNTDCVAGTTDEIAEYIMDLKGEKLFTKSENGYLIAKDSLRYGDDVLMLKKESFFGSQKDYYSVFLAPYMLPKTEIVDWESKQIMYLLLETKPCVLLLEAYQIDKKKGPDYVDRTIEVVIWQKQGDQWGKVTKDYFPLEALKTRLTQQHNLVQVEDIENTVQIRLTDNKGGELVRANIAGTSISNANMALSFEEANLNTLEWENGKFEFRLEGGLAEELGAVAYSAHNPIHLDYVGVLNGTNQVVLNMDLTPKQNANATIAGEMEIRGQETYNVEGLIYTQNKTRNIDLKLLKNGRVEEVLSGEISTRNPSDMLLKGKNNSKLVPNSLVLCNQKVKELLLSTKRGTSLVAYSTEILSLVKIPNGEENYRLGYFGNDWGVLNDTLFKEDGDGYEITYNSTGIKMIKKQDEDHFNFLVSDYTDLYNEGTDQLEMSIYGELKHILLPNTKHPMVLEIGQFVDTITASYPDTDREHENGGGIVRDSDLDGVYFVSYIRVLERSPEGFWINVNPKCMPFVEELEKAVQFFYPQLSNTDYLYNYTESIPEEYLEESVEPILNYQAKIAGFQGALDERSFDPKVFQIEWKDNTLYIAGENGVKLKWDSHKFVMETNAVLNIKTENCFNVDQLKKGKEQKVDYVGNINNEYNIEMEITFGRDEDGGFLSGTYWYTSSKKPIEVSGDYNPFTKEVTIFHYKEGKISETFSGKYGNDCRITGTWK
ncbi:MAG: hypothetical protein GY810_12720, partial [Aureispira sp.]|nr:hypothetical protein [Aureispira sp.]